MGGNENDFSKFELCRYIMIFASLGTMNMSFTRMAAAVDKLAITIQDEVIVQTGYTKYDYQYAKAFDFCTKEEMQDYINKADILILQGGWGAISEAMEKKKKIVVIPRYNQIEHIHDQFQLVKKLADLKCIIGVFDVKELSQKVEEAYLFDFKQLKKGNAEKLIRQTLIKWFPNS